MAQPSELQQLERDFLSGRNPLAYIPLCNSLRKQKNFTRALELCQRGLASDPGSLAGRTLLARLMADIGRYEEAMREIARAEATAPEAQGLMTEKARCLIKMRRFDEANTVMEQLLARNPMDPQVQLLSTQLRQLRGQLKGGTTHNVSRDEAPRFVRLQPQEMLEAIRREIRGHATILSVAVIPTGAGAPALEGDAVAAESAYAFWKETNVCTQELDCGTMRLGILETEKSQLLVVVKRNMLLALCIQPVANIGKIYHRFYHVAAQLLPDAIQA
jgi:tetratricopeptide (TPR) repeat protein